MKPINILFMLFIFLIYITPSNAGYFINIDIPLEYLSVKAGGDIEANVRIVKIGEEDKMDYNIKSYIIDNEDNIITEKSKVIAIDKEVSTVIKFSLPSNIEPGEYIIKVVLDNNEKSTGFIVKSAKENINIYIIYILIFIFIGFFVIFYIYDRKLNKLVKHIKKVHIKDIIKKRKR